MDLLLLIEEVPPSKSVFASCIRSSSETLKEATVEAGEAEVGHTLCKDLGSD